MKTPEEVFAKNFHEGMRVGEPYLNSKGQIERLTFASFKKTHPTLYKVIIRSINEFKRQE